MVLLQLMAPKPKKADSNTSSSGNEKVIKKAKDKAEVKEILKPGKLDKAHDIARGVILGKGGYTAGINTYAIVKDAKAAAQKVKNVIQGESRSELTPEELMEATKGFNPRMSKKVLPDEMVRIAKNVKPSNIRMSKKVLPDEMVRIASKKKK